MQMNKIKAIILGCGSSVGVPIPGCQCEICNSNNEKNHRTRTSIFVEYDDSKILIDTSDLRHQMIKNNLSSFDYLFYTHFHADHFFGSNDLVINAINTKKSLMMFGTEEFMKKMYVKSDFMFDPVTYPFYDYKIPLNEQKIIPRPILIPNIIDKYDEILLKTKKVRCFEQNHGVIKSTGFEFGDGKLVYSPDLKSLPDQTMDFLLSLEIDTWIVPLTNMIETNAHIGPENLKELIKKINPRRVILVHMSHHIGYDEIKGYFSDMANIEPGFDSMKIEIN
jgi:phosphoribosyl 1,2-cyclic phosphate phosphodiesterase